MSISKRAEKIAYGCEDAYSFSKYKSWPAVAAMLLRRGYNDFETEQIMRSKLTRWASDYYGRGNSKVTSGTLNTYLETFPQDVEALFDELRQEVAHKLAPERQNESKNCK